LLAEELEALKTFLFQYLYAPSSVSSSFERVVETIAWPH